MLANKPQASRAAIGEGKRVRRARNIVKRYAELANLSDRMLRRLERAKAVLVYASLSK
jgi:hypothetical protein